MFYGTPTRLFLAVYLLPFLNTQPLIFVLLDSDGKTQECLYSSVSP